MMQLVYIDLNSFHVVVLGMAYDMIYNGIYGK